MIKRDESVQNEIEEVMRLVSSKEQHSLYIVVMKRIEKGKHFCVICETVVEIM